MRRTLATLGTLAVTLTSLPLLSVPLMSALMFTLGTLQAAAYDNDDQALRVRDMIADPSVPLAWDRRRHPETWSYRFDSEPRRSVRCGKRAYWDGEECILKRRYR